MDIQNKDGMTYLTTVDNNSIDLILTDPPYITSTETGMGNLHKQIKENEEKGIKSVKTEEQWESVKEKYIGKKNYVIQKKSLSRWIKHTILNFHMRKKHTVYLVAAL